MSDTGDAATDEVRTGAFQALQFAFCFVALFPAKDLA